MSAWTDEAFETVFALRADDLDEVPFAHEEWAASVTADLLGGAA